MSTNQEIRNARVLKHAQQCYDDRLPACWHDETDDGISDQMLGDIPVSVSYAWAGGEVVITGFYVGAEFCDEVNVPIHVKRAWVQAIEREFQ